MMRFDKRIVAFSLLAAAFIPALWLVPDKSGPSPFNAQDLRDALRSEEEASQPPAGGRRFKRAVPAMEELGLGEASGFAPAPDSPPPPAPVVAAPAAAAPRPTKTVDLSRLFPDPSERNQEQLGSCHDFASIALLEAAIFRKTGVHKRLSEADLFMTRTLMSGDAYRGFVAGGSPDIEEGNFLEKDIGYALRRGVAWSLDYDSFRGIYERLRPTEEIELARVKTVISRYPRYQQDPEFAKEKRRMYAEEALDHGLSPQLDAEVDRRFPDLDKERKEVLELSEGLLQRHSEGGEPSDWRRADPSARADKAQRLGRLLTADLDAGVPVGVSMDIGDLKAWNTLGRGRAMHGFLLIGYTLYSDGNIRFKTRNSWNGNNPDVWGQELYRIRALDKISAPADASPQ